MMQICVIREEGEGINMKTQVSDCGKLLEFWGDESQGRIFRIGVRKLKFILDNIEAVKNFVNGDK